jgi:hypothetical protein
MPSQLPYPLEKPATMPTSAYLLALLAAILRQSKSHELVLTASDILSAEGSAVTISPTGDKKGLILRVTLSGTNTFFVSSDTNELGGPSSHTVKKSLPSPPTRPSVSPDADQPSTSPSPRSRHAVQDDLSQYLREQEMITDREERSRTTEPGLYPFRNVSGR